MVKIIQTLFCCLYGSCAQWSHTSIKGPLRLIGGYILITYMPGTDQATQPSPHPGGLLALKWAMPGDPLTVFTCFLSSLAFPETEGSHCTFWLTNSPKEGVLYPTEIVTHRAGYTQKCLQQAAAFPRGLFCAYYIQDHAFMRLFLSAELSVREPRGSFPPTATIPAAPTAAPATTLALHTQELSSADQTRFSSQSFTAGSTFLFSFLGGFFSCRRKAFPTGFLLINPRARDRVIPVSIWPPSPASTWFLPLH